MLPSGFDAEFNSRHGKRIEMGATGCGYLHWGYVKGMLLLKITCQSVHTPLSLKINYYYNRSQIYITFYRISFDALSISDQITGNNVNDNGTAYWGQVVEPCVQTDTQWAIVFGNHG